LAKQDGARKKASSPPVEEDSHITEVSQSYRGRNGVQPIHLVRDFDSTVAGQGESAVSRQHFAPYELDAAPEFMPQTRWLIFADKALAQAREKQHQIKAKIKPHVERYRKITGNKQ
jgi:hypothetical protein